MQNRAVSDNPTSEFLSIYPFHSTPYLSVPVAVTSCMRANATRPLVHIRRPVQFIRRNSPSSPSPRIPSSSHLAPSLGRAPPLPLHSRPQTLATKRSPSRPPLAMAMAIVSLPSPRRVRCEPVAFHPWMLDDGSALGAGWGTFLGAGVGGICCVEMTDAEAAQKRVHQWHLKRCLLGCRPRREVSWCRHSGCPRLVHRLRGSRCCCRIVHADGDDAALCKSRVTEG